MSDNTLQRLKNILAAAKALSTAMVMSARSEDEIVWKYGSYKVFLRKYNDLARQVAVLVPIETVLDLVEIDKVKGIGDTLPIQQKEFFDIAFVNLSILIAFLEEKVGANEDRIQGLKDFARANLRRFLFSIPSKEVEVQDAVEQLLIGRGLEKGVDYDREVGRVKVSIKEVIPDFILPKLGMAIEVKLSTTKDKSKVIVDEINADIMSYGREYSTLLFIVYDLGSIRDEVEFKRDLEVTDSVSVIIIKH